MSRVRRALGFVALALLGAWVGALGIVVSRMTAEVAAISVPYGLVLAVAAVAALDAEGRRALGVAGALGAALGWTVSVLVAMGPRPEGDVVLAGDGYGIGYVVLGLVAAGWNVARGLSSDGPSRPQA